MARREERVLIVDDDPEMRSLLRDLLEGAGYRVRLAGDTLTGLSLLLQEEADVLLVDWRIPGSDGFRMLESVKRSFPGLPVIFMTAYACPDIYCRAMECGAHSFLTKPFHLDDLLKEIESAIWLREVPASPRSRSARPDRAGDRQPAGAERRSQS